MCGHCSKVVKHDLIKPYLEEGTVEVDDMRDDVGKKEDKDKKESSSGSNTNSDNSGANNVTQQSSKSEREIITQQGKAGLEKVKERELEDWLTDIDNVGPQTINRITRVFQNNDTISENPNALFNYLDDELSCSDQLINTLVNTVFAKEREHADLLQSQGFVPAISESGSLQLDGRQSMNGNNQNSQGQGQQQVHQQGVQPQQQQSGDDSLTTEEALQMIQASKEDEQGSRRRGPASDALDTATEEAIQNFAENMGGFFGMAQNLMENTLMAYFEDNPEKLIENMDLIQTFMEDDADTNTTTQQTESKSKENQKIDNAIDDIREEKGLEPNSTGNDHSTSDSDPAFREPEQINASEPEAGENNESSFEPDPGVVGGGGSDDETHKDGPVTQDENWNTANGAEPDYDNDETQQNESESNGDDDEDDWFDEQFGDEVEVEG